MDVIVADARLGSIPQNIRTDGINGTRFFCVGSHRYTAKLGTQVKADQLASPNAQTIVAGVVQDNVNGCPTPSGGPGANAQQLLGPDMQLNSIDFNCDAYSSCSIKAHVVFYGADNTVLTPSHTDAAAQCSANLLSSQFCAVADINTNVTIRY